MPLLRKKTTTKKVPSKKVAKKVLAKKAVTKTSKEPKAEAPEESGRKYRKNVADPDGVKNPAAAAVRKLRGEMTLVDFAKMCGLMHAPAVARVERHDYYSTSVKTLLQIAEGCDKTLVISFKDNK